ncbi:hypothetical protein GUA46_06845 [Muricauda sp. HICW]|uniref:RHS repeat-associated core domain-containing protein n=1 Tax=Flagellimonas chongwuensis TaxID=2697365 RepID=A0A850NA03_9FLAO|nr:RHS repeat-associated core domain-containing protein [Allomuricauda chongwuensis]NVN18051.1 hypothetical protein [Allomuricauda chongwuensis]
MTYTDIRLFSIDDVFLEGYTDYYPFGMPMPNRGLMNAYGYRYAFQGQEKDPETGKEAFQLRLWDGRIGRWLTTDPYGQYASPYLGMGNDPINGIDPDGGWKWKLFAKWARNRAIKAGLDPGELYKSNGEWGFNTSSVTSGFTTDADAIATFNYTSAWKNDIPAAISAHQPNWAENLQTFAEYNPAINQAPGGKMAFDAIYNIANDAYVYGTRNFTKNGGRHLTGFVATPKEEFNAGMNTFLTFTPSPLKSFRVAGPKLNVSTFGKTFKGTFLTKLSPRTRGDIIIYSNKATDQIHGKRLMNVAKSQAENLNNNN